MAVFSFSEVILISEARQNRLLKGKPCESVNLLGENFPGLVKEVKEKEGEHALIREFWRERCLHKQNKTNQGQAHPQTRASFDD